MYGMVHPMYSVTAIDVGLSALGADSMSACHVTLLLQDSCCCGCAPAMFRKGYGLTREARVSQLLTVV